MKLGKMDFSFLKGTPPKFERLEPENDDFQVRNVVLQRHDFHVNHVNFPGCRVWSQSTQVDCEFLTLCAGGD